MSKQAQRVSELERELAEAKGGYRPLEVTLEHLKQEKSLLAEENKWLNEQAAAKVRLGCLPALARLMLP